MAKKFITESELKAQAARLKEKLIAEDQKVDEWNLLSPSSWFNGRGYGDGTSRDDVRTQDAAKNSAAGANMALVQNREQMVPGSTGSTEEGGVTYAIDDAGNKLAKINPQTQKWEMMPQAAAPEAPAAAPAAPAAPEPYTVVKGDNLTKIAKQMGTTLPELLKANPQFQKNPDLIYPGQKVNPPGAAAPAAQNQEKPAPAAAPNQAKPAPTAAPAAAPAAPAAAPQSSAQSVQPYSDPAKEARYQEWLKKQGTQ